MLKVQKFLKIGILLRKCLGNVNNAVNFEYGEGAVVEDGCAATLNGEFWYLGGSSNKKQVSW